MTQSTKKFSFENLKILPKLLLVMLILSWIPLAAAIGLGIKARNDAIAYEMENTILEVISGAAQDIRQGTINMVMENLTVAQSVLLDPTVLNYALNYEPDNPPEISIEEGMALIGRLQALTNNTPSLQQIELHDMAGNVLVSTDTGNIGTNNSTRPDLQGVLKGSNFSAAILPNSRGYSYRMFVSIPFMNESGIVGIISLQLQTEFLNTMIREVGDKAGVNIFVMDTNGVILSHSDPASDWVFRSAQVLSEDALGHYRTNPNSPVPIYTESLSPLYKAVDMAFETNSSGRFVFCHPEDLDQPLVENCAASQRSQVAYEIVPDPIHQTPLFLVMVEVLEGPYTTAALQQTVLSLVFALLIGVSLISVSVFVARSMAKPIQRMAEAAQQVENEADFDPQTLEDISVHQDEIGKLSRIFSDMVVALQAREKKLKKEIVRLKIEIDAQKQEEEIDNIVSQDFFLELQRKAKDFKKDRRRTTPDKDE